MGNRKAYIVIAIILGSLFVASFAVFLFFLILNKTKDNIILTYALLAAIPIFSITFVYFFSRYIAIRNTTKALKQENLYNLGKSSTFFGINAFSARVVTLRKVRFLAKKKQYLIAFTAANLVTVQNANRDESIILLNARIAEFLDRTIIHKNKKLRRKYMK